MLNRQKRHFLGYQSYFLGAAAPRVSAEAAQKRDDDAREDADAARQKRQIGPSEA